MNYRLKKYIGIDLHTSNFTAFYINKNNEKHSQTFNIDPKSIKEFVKTLRRYDEIAIETVSNADYFRSIIEKHVKKIVLVPTSNFAVISKSVKKNDKADAELLAYFLKKDMLPRTRFRSKIAKAILSLISLRALLVRERVALVNHVHSKLVENGVKAHKGTFRTNGFEKYIWSRSWDNNNKNEFLILETHINSINKSIESLTNQIIVLAKENFRGFNNILEIKGIGELSCSYLLAYIDEINDFSNPNKLCSYLGVVPITRVSNNVKQKNMITRKSSSNIRATLRLCSFSAVKNDPYMQKFYSRIKRNTGVSAKAYAACSRKLIVLVYHLLKNDISFEEFKKSKNF